LRPDSTQNRIEGNFIGTDFGGTFDEGNAVGVQFSKSNTSASNTIGGNSPAARNLISGNNSNGVGSFESTNNLVAGNLIGTKKDGITVLGNSSGGVSIIRASNNTVSGNTIAFNGEDGVGIFSIGTGNFLAGNSIFSNVEEGIDLGLD
jgi:Right handed beta helix region